MLLDKEICFKIPKTFIVLPPHSLNISRIILYSSKYILRYNNPIPDPAHTFNIPRKRVWQAVDM